MNRTRRDPDRLKRDVREGVRAGLYFATAYSIVATAIMVGGGFAAQAIEQRETG